MKKVILIMLMLFLSAFETKGQSRWIQQYLDDINASGHHLSLSYDDGYLLTGRVVPGYEFTWLIKTDVNGELLWERKVRGYYDMIKTDRIKQNEEGEIFLAGSVVLDGYTDAMVMKLNACGEKEWCRTLSTTSNYDFFTDIVTTSDGGCAALVINAFHPLFIYRKGILRFSSDGDLSWQQYYQSQDQEINDEVINNLLLTPDNGFLMTGYCYYPDPDDPDLYWLHPYYVKTDSLGNFEWETIVHKETADIGGEAWETIISPSKEYYYSSINHYYHTDNLYSRLPALVKLDLDGNVIDVYDLIHEVYDWGSLRSAVFINDTQLAGGATWFNNEDQPISRAVIFDTLGNIRDSLTLLNTGWLSKTAVTHDGKLLFYNTIEEDGDFDTYLFKLTQELEQDTFYTTPFSYDSLCPYQIVSDTIVPDDCGLIVGIEEEEPGGGEARKRGSMEIWPNPASGVIHGRLNKDDGRFYRDLTLVIYDIFGREIQLIRIQNGQEEFQINVEGYPPGVYIVILKKYFDIMESRKFVVDR